MAEAAFWENDKTVTEDAFWEKDKVVSDEWWEKDKETSTPVAEAFLDSDAGTSVSRMAAATRHTLGVVGRAVSAFDVAAANSPGPGEEDSYERQVSDIGLTPAEVEGAQKQAEGIWVWERGKQVWYPSKEAAGEAFKTHMEAATARADRISSMPLVTLPRADLGMMGPSQANVPTGAKVAAGAYNAAKALPEFFTTDLGASLIAAGGLPAVAHRLIAAGFAVDLAAHTPQQIAALNQAVESKDPQAISEAATALGMNVALTGLTAKHALTTPNPAVEAARMLSANVKATGKTVDPELQRVAPLTAEAVKGMEQTVRLIAPSIETKAAEPLIAPETIKPSEVPPSQTPLTTEAVKAVTEKGTDAIQKQSTDAGVLRQERPEVELPPMGEGNAKPEEVARTQATTPPVSSPPREAPITKPEGERALTSENPFDTSVTSARLRELDKSKPRPTDKLYGKSGGTPELRAENDAKLRKWTNERAKAVREHRALVEQSNEWIRQNQSVPQHLRPSKSTQAILDSQPAITPPEGGMKTAAKPAPEGGAILGIGGRRPAPPATVGATPRGDRHWLRIPSVLKRIGRGLFTEGARAVLGRTRNQVGQELSRATRRHVDVEQELFGMHEATLRTAVRAIPRQRLDAAMTEASQYFREVENNRPAPALSPEAQSLVDAWFAIGRSTGDIARANDVQVFDPALGRHRPMGTVENYVPRMFTPEVEAVLRDPQADPVLFNRLAQEIATQRNIPLDVAANELRGVAGRFQANDYMANLELARGAQMPEIFYEYNLRNLAARYLPSFSERMAQIIAYGQRLGPRDAPERMNLWDVARRESEDAYTQQWLNAAEDQATGFKPKSELEKNARRLQALASATLLSDPTTTVPRNLLSGLAATTEAYGVGRSVRQFRNAMRLGSRLAARELGAVRDDLAAFLNSDQLGDSALDNAIRRTSEFTLRASGFTGSENFVRTHNALVASTFARDAAAALAANPASKLSREALAQFQRWNINPETIIAEGGNWRTGPETRAYMRTAVREMQGGYRFDQVPLWANSTAGRFFYQYGRWGVQRSQNIFQNIIRPAIGEDVQFRGQRMTHRDTLPLIRAGALLIGLGETFGAISYGLFGRDRRDSSLSEIGEAWSEDELKAVGLLGERMVNDIIMAGTLGIIGQPLDIAKAAKDQSRFKNPLDPPSAAGIKTFVGLAQKAVDQDGTLTKKDWLDAASGVVRGPKNVTDVARHHLGESLYEGQNDQRTLRNAARRWAKETREDVPLRGGMKDFRKSPTAPAYEAVNEALLAGNAEAAKKAADEFIAEAKDKAKARTALKSSVRARQPFRAGNLTSDAQRNEFMRWAEKNLSAADLEQIKRVQERYRKTAADAGLL